MLMFALWIQAGPDAAMGAIQDMNNSLEPYIVGHAIGTTIYDSLFVVVFLSVITIVRYFVSRNRKAKV
jgi:hypothetical protein